MKQPMTDWACPVRQGRVAMLQDYRPTPVVPTPILSIRSKDDDRLPFTRTHNTPAFSLPTPLGDRSMIENP